MQELIKELRQYYIKVLIPGVILVILGVFYEQLGDIHFNYPGKWISFSLLIIVVSTGYIVPLWMRIHALNKFKKTTADSDDFVHFEHNAIILAVAGIYLCPPAFIMHFPDIPKYAIALSAIYSLYYFFPSEKKIKMDLKIFRLKPEDFE